MSDYEYGKMDMREHQRTWALFTKLTKWGIVFNVLLLAFLAIFRTHS